MVSVRFRKSGVMSGAGNIVREIEYKEENFDVYIDVQGESGVTDFSRPERGGTENEIRVKQRAVCSGRLFFLFCIVGEGEVQAHLLRGRSGFSLGLKEDADDKDGAGHGIRRTERVFFSMEGGYEY